MVTVTYIFRRCMLLSALAIAPVASAQLNENCIVSVLNRNTQVGGDGSWTLPNIPAGFGVVRARANCVNGGITTSGQSELFSIQANRMNAIPQIPLGNTTPVPTSLTITAPTNSLNSIGQNVQLTVTASYASGPTANVTAGATGTAYTVSNPAIATISVDGLVTAVATGTVVVQAINEGRSDITSISVLVAGADSDGDGIPDDWEISHGLNPQDPSDAVLDIDHDGLTNLEEYRLGTDIRNVDTDGDGINDGDEAHSTGLACGAGRCFHTSPLLADTDGDGVNDLTEIRTGSDPTDPRSVNYAQALTGIVVTPNNFTLIVNSLNSQASVQLAVIGNLIDGKTIDLTAASRGTNYISSNINTCNFGSPDGRVFAGTAGSCVITISSNGFVATANGNVTNFTPADLSFATIPGFANAVAVSGDYAYVAAGASGLQVVGLSSDRLHPAVVGALSLTGNAFDVTLAGNTAYVVGSTTLSAVDITNPQVPVLRGTFSSGNCLGIAVRGTSAYMNCANGLRIVNVTNPSAMIEVSTFAVSGTPWKLAVDTDRHFAAMAMGTSGLKLVDITNPAAPTLLGSASTGDARAVALNGNWAYVADYSNSTNSVDISNLRSPVVKSHITDRTLGGVLQDIALSGSFALGACVNFLNGIPFTDISNPNTLVARAILNFTQRNDYGMGIAVDPSFVYLVTEHNSFTRGGSTGDSRLYIGQYMPREDLAGIPPTASITSPTNDSTVYQGAQLTVAVNATDDIAVASVDFLVNSQVVFTTTSTPYQYTFTVPSGVNTLTLGARAHDLGNNIGTATNVVVNVLPDPLTLVTGVVTDQNNAPIAGAAVTAPGGLTGVTGPDGTFSIANVPTVLGNIQVNVSSTNSSGTTLSGASASVTPVLGGVTNVGTVQLIPASFNTNYGTLVSRCDDCDFPYTLPFAFSFYGTPRTQAFVGTNGYITFTSGDSTYTESLPAFNSLPRISAFFDDLYAGPSPDPTSGMYVNNTIPGQFIVTYLKNPHFNTAGPFNTLQIQLFSDGRIVFAYSGISSLNTGTIVGLTPGPNSPSQAVNYTTQTNVNIAAGTAVYEYFNDTLLFNLDHSFIVFTPVAGGGYNVRTLTSASPGQSGIITGTSSVAITPSVMTSNALPAGAISPSKIANAEIIVHSGVNPNYIGMTNADANGNFVLSGVPIGNVVVEARKKGQIIASGTGVYDGGTASGPQALRIVLSAPVDSTKTAPQDK